MNKDFGEKPEGKNSLVNPRSKWKDDITIDLKINGAKKQTRFSWLRIQKIGGLL